MLLIEDFWERGLIKMREKKGKKSKDDDLEWLTRAMLPIMGPLINATIVTYLEYRIEELEKKIKKLEDRVWRLEEKVEVEGHGQA